jgi:hypothetical protein
LRWAPKHGVKIPVFARLKIA